MTEGEPASPCDACGVPTPAHGAIHVAGAVNQRLCQRCYNAQVAELAGIDFEHPEFTPITLADIDGKQHTFSFVARFYPTGLGIEATEAGGGKASGYEFDVLGDFDADPLELFAELFRKVRRELDRRHLVRRSDGSLGLADGDTLRGRIAWDDATNGEIPILVVDGEPLTWDELGRMLMTYEGFLLKLEVRDSTEEL